MLSLFLLAQALAVFAASSNDWRSRSIYQVVTDRFALTNGSTTQACSTSAQKYCGGTWSGLISRLDYIKNMGFTAVWISPVTSQISSNSSDGDSYHGYWQNDLYSLNSAFGNVSDLKALSSALHQRGMYLMVDVVANHFAWPGNYSMVDYATYAPFNDSSYFHKYCAITNDDYSNNQTAVEDCWMGDSNVELTDLDTTNTKVISLFQSWIKSLVSTYGIDGLRIDTVRNVNGDFWPGFVSAAGVYAVGEVFDGDPSYTCPWQSYVPGLLNYPAYFAVNSAFSSTSGNMPALAASVQTVKSTCSDTTLMGSFLENHDNPRFPSLTSDMALAQNAIGFTMLADGIPIVYQGQEQHYAGGSTPNNREALWLSGYNTNSTLYQYIAKINTLRNHVVSVDSGNTTYKGYSIYNDTTTIAMRKGSDGFPVLGVWSNKGSQGAAYSQSISNTGFKGNVMVTEVLSCTNVTTARDGSINVAMGQGAPKVRCPDIACREVLILKIFYPTLKLAGSGLCATGGPLSPRSVRPPFAPERHLHGGI